MTKRRPTFINYVGGLLDVRVRGYGIQVRVRPRPWAWQFVTPRHLSLYDVKDMVGGEWYVSESAGASVVPLEEYRQRRK